jgi:hypothetical protein
MGSGFLLTVLLGRSGGQVGGRSAVAEAAYAFAVAAEFGAQEAGERGHQPARQVVEFGGRCLAWSSTGGG